ncbi:hypothetical protein ACFX11_008712 [Malus domestica]
MDSGLDQTIVLFCPRLSPMFLNPASFLSWKLSGLMTLTAGKLSRQGGMKVLEGVSYTNGLLLWASCCRRRLIAWSKEKFSKDHELAGQLLGELEQIQSSFILNNARELEISAQLSSIWAIEEKFWQQRSRISWLPNTRFVHLTTMQMRCKNKITRVANEDGVWAEENASITLEMNALLCSPFTNDEVKDAAFHLGSLKAHGPDGFPGFFYNRFWHILNETIVCTTNDFSKENILLSQINKTHIALIPKVPNPENTSQYRPISLCCNSYKILSKILANRLNTILPNIISCRQNAFVPHRQIQDNLLVAHEVFHYLKLKSSGGRHELGLKLDMNKAYERVEWDFLEETMRMMSFNEGWIGLVMGCVTTISFWW